MLLHSVKKSTFQFYYSKKNINNELLSNMTIKIFNNSKIILIRGE